MSRIRRANTNPEISAKKRFRWFRYQPKGFFGNPDFINKKKKIVIFIDGCFWHKCPQHWNKPKSNRIYWNEKIKKNIERDKKVNKKYIKEGWKVIRIWEHEFR